MKTITYNGLLLTLLSIFFLISCNNHSSESENLQRLKSWMTGSFSSQEQSEVDTNFFHINLEMVQIWEERTDAIWLYVEQAAAWALDKPYRQRVYSLKEKVDGTFESAIFAFNEPLRYAGVWKEVNPLNQLTPDSLIEREGCAIILEFKKGVFVGSTDGKNCSSQLRGSSYATSDVRIEEMLLTSWDRGYDSTNTQVWGAETGPYIFKKLKDSD